MLAGWFEYPAAFAVFFLSHSIPVRPPVRGWLVARLGPSGFTLGYSILSVGVLAWVISAAGRAPYVPLWYWAPWHNHITVAVMCGVCVLLALTIGRPNPFSFGGSRNAEFDPANPGFVRFIRHPLLLAMALWAFAHVVPNGDLAHVILFTVFGIFALLGRKIIDRRKRREMGENWFTLSQQVKAASWRPDMQNILGTLLRVAIGLALYGVLIWIHPFLFGVEPLP